jgi:uncharacterized protein (TIGR02611 family)
MQPTGTDRQPTRENNDMGRLHGKNAAKAVAIQVLGWLLVLVGIAALALPGPGLLALFAGMALLATQYSWAERRLEPVKKAALRAAADSVATPPRLLMSVLGVLALIAVGVVWGLRPDAPGWWPVADRWWLAGGWGTGATLIFSGLVAGATVVYSYRNFREIRRDQAADENADEAHASADESN